MPVLQFQRDPAGEISINPQVVKIHVSDELAVVTAAGYFNPYMSMQGLVILPTDMLLIAYDGGEGFFVPSFSGNEVTFSQLSTGGTAGAKAASDNTSPTVASVVGAPVVANNFASFADTAGSVGDSGYLPSDATKTNVVMAGSAVQVGYIAHFVDVAGTIDDTAGNVINAGNIQAGLSGTAGTLISFPATAANGSLIVSALNAGADFSTTIRNSVMGQASVVSIPDPGAATANFLLSASAGTQTVATGNIGMTAGYLQESAVNALTAFAGGGQGSATALTRQINRVTTVATAGDSVLLPVSVAGRVVTVINAAAANAMDVFPQSGDAINALAANTALSVAANKTVIFFCAVAGTWNSVLTA